jgi:hypothetical protein
MVQFLVVIFSHHRPKVGRRGRIVTADAAGDGHVGTGKRLQNGDGA